MHRSSRHSPRPRSPAEPGSTDPAALQAPTGSTGAPSCRRAPAPRPAGISAAPSPSPRCPAGRRTSPDTDNPSRVDRQKRCDPAASGAGAPLPDTAATNANPSTSWPSPTSPGPPSATTPSSGTPDTPDEMTSRHIPCPDQRLGVNGQCRRCATGRWHIFVPSPEGGGLLQGARRPPLGLGADAVDVPCVDGRSTAGLRSLQLGPTGGSGMAVACIRGSVAVGPSGPFVGD